MSLNIIMYHYVRELSHSRYPNLKGLNLSEFNYQIDYFAKNYNVIRPQELILIIREERDVPDTPSVVLTFDDGYSDHYNNAFPVLLNKGFSGFFFPPYSAVIERRLLDVNKIHLILENTKNIDAIISSISEFITINSNDFNLRDFDNYFQELAIANRFDPKEIIFVKRILQHALPAQLRQELINQLFNQFVRINERVIVEELYLTLDQLKVMNNNGMLIGGHGDQHIWLNKCDYSSQRQEIERSKELLLSIGVDKNELTFCYPYGGYNDLTLDILSELGFCLSFTTKVAPICGSKFSALELPRFDTNDFPKNMI